MKGQWPRNLAEDVKRRFDQWYSANQQKLSAGLELQTHTALSHSHSNTSVTSHHQIITGSNGNSRGSPSNLSVNPSHQHSHLVNGSSSSIVSSVRHHLLDKGVSSVYEDDNNQSSHPVFHGLTTQKTRMRTSFDPEMELPRLQQWFAENPHPSRHQVSLARIVNFFGSSFLKESQWTNEINFVEFLKLSVWHTTNFLCDFFSDSTICSGTEYFRLSQGQESFRSQQCHLLVQKC